MSSDDAALLDRWRNGDTDAGESLFNRYYDMIERFFLNKVSGSVEDLVQETFMACVEGRHRLRDKSKFRSYLFSIAYNVLRTHYQESSRSGKNLNLDQVSVYDLAPGPSTIIAKQREQRLLLEALRTLPIAYQVIIELHYWEHLTTEEMADILDLPLGTVRSRLRRAREMLEQSIRRLAESPQELEHTVTHLDTWAEQCRAQLAAGTE